MDEKELEQAVKKLLVEACSSRRVLEPGIDLLESGLLDSLGLITLLDRAGGYGHRNPAHPGGPQLLSQRRRDSAAVQVGKGIP